MKCLVMAGGAGNRLWPLSRREYPKQFIDLRGGRSMFQETIARNLAFCDEFWIATTKEYHHIVECQLKVFQNLKYRCFLEERPLRTAPITVLACLYANPSEMILFVSTDHIIEGQGYRTAITTAMQLMKEGRMACLGVKPTSTCNEHGMLTNQDGRVLCHERVTEEQARELIRQGGWYWDCGIQAFKAGDFLQAFKKSYGEAYRKLYRCIHELDFSTRNIVVTADCLEGIDPLGIGEAVTGKSDRMTLVGCTFQWKRIMNLQALSEYYGQETIGQVIMENCDNVSIINYSPQHLTVTNDLQDLVVVHTNDATYVTSKRSSQQIKEIGFAKSQCYQNFFEQGTSAYYEWGTSTLLVSDCHMVIHRLVVFALMSAPMQQPNAKNRQLICLSGKLQVVIKGELSSLREGEAIWIHRTTFYTVVNTSDDDLTFIEIDIEPIISLDDVRTVHQQVPVPLRRDAIVRMDPIFKDYLWGGTLLRTRFGKKCDYDVIGESWELSTHRMGQSTVGTGAYTGMLFGEYISRIGRDVLGWKCSASDRFPLLIKFIDARDWLSVQVHPNDEYALQREDDYGKTEMWHIISCEPGSFIYYGFNREVTRQEVSMRATNGTLVEVLNKVPVKAGQEFLIRSGQVHAIGPGILLCEIQQSSNLTYRLYDYNRTDQYGNHRELHLSQALDVLDYSKLNWQSDIQIQEKQGGSCSCKYFSTTFLKVPGCMTLHMDTSSFAALVFLQGEGFVTAKTTTLPFHPADTFFIPADKQLIEINGECELLYIHI